MLGGSLATLKRHHTVEVLITCTTVAHLIYICKALRAIRRKLVHPCHLPSQADLLPCLQPSAKTWAPASPVHTPKGVVKIAGTGSLGRGEEGGEGK